MRRNKTRGVEIFRIVREKLEWTAYRMAAEMGMSQSQYKYLEERSNATTQQNILKLQQLSGWSGNEFMKHWASTLEEKKR